jgi:uncharacterized protein (DUF433 family)
MVIAMPAAVDVPLWTDDNGKIRIGGTRVLLELVIHAFQQGETAESIIDSYPTLKLAEVYAVIAYYLTHRAEVDQYMRQAADAAAKIRSGVEAEYTQETRERLARLRATRDEKRHSDS